MKFKMQEGIGFSGLKKGMHEASFQEERTETLPRRLPPLAVSSGGLCPQTRLLVEQGVQLEQHGPTGFLQT